MNAYTKIKHTHKHIKKNWTNSRTSREGQETDGSDQWPVTGEELVDR